MKTGSGLTIGRAAGVSARQAPPAMFDVIPGGPGPDTLAGTEGADDIEGFGGDDVLIGRGGSDSIGGGDDQDYLRGDGGDDTLFGENGHDYLRGGYGDDVVDGGAGFDRAAFFDATTGVRVDLRLQGGFQDTGQGSDYLAGIEHLSGTRHDDRLIGDDGGNWLWGDISALDPGVGGGNDTLIGNGGDDLLDVGKGDHRLVGGAGVDAVSVLGNQSDTPGGVTLDLTLQGAAQATGQGLMYLKGVERLSGSIHDDTFTGDGGANLLAGHDGGDLLSGGGGADILYGDGAIGVFPESGTSGPIEVLQQVDYAGTPAAAGHDTLIGGGGRDILLGGLGGDTLTGETAPDTFAYRVIEDSLAGDSDFVTDFGGKDTIDLKAIDADATTSASNEAFHFVDEFTGAAAEAVLEYDRDRNLTYLLLDVDGDGEADGIIKIAGHARETDDFVL